MGSVFMSFHTYLSPDGLQKFSNTQCRSILRGALLRHVFGPTPTCSGSMGWIKVISSRHLVLIQASFCQHNAVVIFLFFNC